MDLPITAVRRELESLLHPAPGQCALVDFDLVERAGLTIVERRIPAVDLAHNYKCVWFVFRRMLQEPRFTVNLFSNDIFDDPTAFLGGHGFIPVHTPSEGDVLAYVSRGEIYTQAHHFGLFQQGKVLSKFGVGHIFKHDIPQVPVSYGEQVLFYRRN